MGQFDLTLFQEMHIYIRSCLITLNYTKHNPKRKNANLCTHIQVKILDKTNKQTKQNNTIYTTNLQYIFHMTVFQDVYANLQDLWIFPLMQTYTTKS